MEKKELPDVIYVNKENGQMVAEGYPNSEAYEKITKVMERKGGADPLVTAINAASSVREVVQEMERWRAVLQYTIEEGARMPVQVLANFKNCRMQMGQVITILHSTYEQLSKNEIRLSK